MQQRSDEWFQARLGKVTASKVSDVMAKTKTGPAASRQNYMMQLLCERLTGKKEDTYQSDAMRRGEELEPAARTVYEAEMGLLVVETGLIAHPEIEHFAASPDGLIDVDGMLEIKCPNTATHIQFIQSLKPEGKYQWQMLCQMACAGRDWVDFVSFDDRLPPALQYQQIRFYRDEGRIKEMEAEVRRFLDELAELEYDMRNKMEAA